MIAIQLSDGRIVQIDTDDPQAAAKAGRRLELREKYEAEADAQHPSQNLSGLGKFAVGAGRGFHDTLQGVKQIGNQALSGLGFDRDEALQSQQRQQANEMEEFNKIPGSDEFFSAAGLGRLAGGVASTPLPAAKAASGLARIGKAAGYGAAAGGSQYVEEGGSRLANAGLGAAFGAGGQGLAEGGGRVVNKIANQRKGNLKNADVLKRAEAEGVPVGFDDVSGSPTAAKVGNYLDRIPFIGNASNRRATQHALESSVIRRLGDAGDEVGLFEGIQKSAKLKLKSLSSKAGVKYDALARKMDPQGPVSLDEFTKVYNSKLAGRLLPEDAENAILRVGRHLDQKFGKGGGSGSYGAGTFTEARNFRTDMSGLIDKNLGVRAEAHLLDLKRALEKDMHRFAVSNDGKKLWSEADNFYKKEVLSVKTAAIRRAVNDQDPTKLWRLLSSTQGMKGGNPDHARRMYKLLTPKGKKMARQGLFKEAFDASIAQGEFSPAIMANQLQQKARLFKQFAPTDDIDGFVKLMRATRAAGRLAENPPTGNRVIDIILFGGAVTEPVATVGSVFTAKFLFNNPTARNFLLAAKNTTPGTAKMGRLVNKFVAYMQRAATLSQAQPED